MARKISEIYESIIEEKNKCLELTELQSDSKMSVMGCIAWIVATVIHSFEVLLDVFVVDMSNAIASRINGTPGYYVQALLKYQHGDSLKVREDGLAFGYEVTDESKRLISQAAYQEDHEEGSLDTKLILKVAKGVKGQLEALNKDELMMVMNYLNEIKFAGTTIDLVSRKGDVLIPRLSVFHTGSLPEEQLLVKIDEALNDYIMSIGFNSMVYVNKILDCLRNIKEVTDVYADPTAVPEQGVFLVCYDGDSQQQGVEKVERLAYTASGYLRQSSRQGEEKDLPTFREAIVLKVGDDAV